MPIRFRCPHCTRLLGIARRKAGTQTNCPQCGRPLTVPTEDGPGEPLDLDELDVLINGTAHAEAHPVEPAAPAAVQELPPAPVVTTAPAPARPAPRQHRKPAEDPPLFEEDVDALLGITRHAEPTEPAEPPGRKGKAKPVSGMDALSLDDHAGHLVLSPQKATLLVVAVVLLIGLAFAAGYLLASRA